MDCVSMKNSLLALPCSTCRVNPHRFAPARHRIRFQLPSPPREAEPESKPELKSQPSSPPTLDNLPATSVSLTRAFGRRFVVGGAAALAIAFGGNLGGVTSFFLGLNANFAQDLKLDVLYPVNGFKRCKERDFEFTYPAAWVGDQRLLYRAAEQVENLHSFAGFGNRSIQKRSPTEPIVAFGPPGSSGELNVSVIVAPVPLDFRLEKIGGPKEAGELILNNFIASRSPKVVATLHNAQRRDETMDGQRISYYTLEFSVEGQSFLRHNVAVYAAHNGQLLSLNAQTPEVLWPNVMEQFHKMANSFKVIL